MPIAPAATIKIIDSERVSYFGCGAQFLRHTQSSGTRPASVANLSSLKLVTSTGSPLPPDTAKWFYSGAVTDSHADCALASIAGGTELNGCLCIASPFLPVYPGEIQSASLAMDVTVFDEAGNRVKPGEAGELVCLSPSPSMPVSFWNDPTGQKYHDAYFSRFGESCWAHSDFAQLTTSNGFVILGRSDSTLNPGGVRIGTSDYYNIFFSIPFIKDSLVVSRRFPDTCDEEIVAYVTRSDLTTTPLTDAELATILQTIRKRLSPKHLPAAIKVVSEIPHNINGKKLEKLIASLINNRKSLSDSQLLFSCQNPSSSLRLSEFFL